MPFYLKPPCPGRGANLEGAVAKLWENHAHTSEAGDHDFIQYPTAIGIPFNTNFAAKAYSIRRRPVQPMMM